MAQSFELLDPIRARIDAATPGPWHGIGDDMVTSSKKAWPSYNPHAFGVCRMTRPDRSNDRDFIAHVRTDADRMERGLRAVFEITKIKCNCRQLGERCGRCELRNTVAAILRGDA